MDFLKVVKRRSLWSEVAYVLLNILLACVILVVVRVIESPTPAFALVLLSKWRVLAVRPRYWGAHVLSNTIDIIVSLSLVVLLYAAGHALGVQLLITLLYIVWLLFIKPRSRRRFIIAQAGIGLVVGMTALVTVSPDWDPFVVVLGAWAIAASAARHTLLAYGEESHVPFLSLLWGFVIAEIVWLSYHWTIAYELVGAGGIKLPQITIVVFLLSFLAERSYASYVRNNYQRIRFHDVQLPILLTVSVIVMLLVFFNAAPNSLV